MTEALPMFKNNPSLVLNVLEQLKEDSSLYVRRSVANNLNDISKDNPSILLGIIKRWKGENQNSDWMSKNYGNTNA